MSILVCKEEDIHVTNVRIFKSHDDHHHEYIQGQFLLQVTDYTKTNGNIIPLKRSTLAPVPFGTSLKDLSSRIGLFQLIHCSVLDSKSFSDLTSKKLAEQITAKIMTRFRFMTTTSCSNIIIAVSVYRIYKSDFFHLIADLGDHGAVSGSFLLYIFDNEEANMDDDNDDDDDVHNDNDNYDDDDDDDGFSEVTGLVDVKSHEELNYMDRCSVCLEEYGSDYSGVVKAETLVCSHVFHRDCIHTWLQYYSNRCPLCRSVFIAQI